MRGVLRWLRRLVLGAVLLGALVLAIALVTAHTGWGRERLRRGVEAKLREAFPGGARVRRIDGSILGTLTVRDVELVSGDRALWVVAGSVRADVALWPLLVNTVRVDSLIATDVAVRVALGRSPAAPAPGPAPPPSPWRFELPRVAIREARVELAREGSTQRLVDLVASGGVTIDATGVSVAGWVHGRWQGAGELTATGAVAVSDAVRVPGALITLGGATLVASQLTIDADRPSGTAVLRAPARALAELWPAQGGGLAADRLGDVTATIEVAGATPTRLELDATAGGTRLWASLHGDLARRTASGVISATAADLAAVSHGQITGRGAVLAAVDGDANRVRGTLIVSCDAPGGVAPARIAPAPSAASANAGSTASVRGVPRAARSPSIASAPKIPIVPSDVAAGDPAIVRCGTPGVPVTSAIITLDATLGPDRDALQAFAFGRGRGVSVFATAAGHRASGAIVLDDARATATASEVDVAGAALTGALAATARASGSVAPTADLAITGELSGAARFDDVALTGLRGRFAVRASPALRLDRAGLTATEIRRGGTRLGRARVALEARGSGGFGVVATAWPAASGVVVTTAGLVSPDATQTVARLARTQVTLPGGMTWLGTGGSVVMTDRAVALHDLVLGSGDARVALGGELVRRTGALVARIDADRIAADTIDASARGRGHGTLALGRRNGQWHADGRFEVAGFAAVPDASPIDGTAHLVLDGPRITLDAAAMSPRLGRVELALETDAPRDLFDLRAWRRHDLHAVRQATVTARHVELTGVTELGGRPTAGTEPLRGTLDGTVNLAPGALGGALAIRGLDLGLGAAFGTLDADVSFAPQGSELRLETLARLSGASGTLTARFAMPVRPFDPVTWQHGGRDLVTEAALAIDDVAFDSALLEKLGVPRLITEPGNPGTPGAALPYRGHASARLSLDAAATQARLAIDVRDVTGGVLALPVSQHLTVTAGPSGTHVHAGWSARAPELGSLGELDADLPVTADRWLTEPRWVLDAPLTARWTLPPRPVVPILAVLGRHDLTAGTLEGDAEISGTLRAPIVARARLVARDVVIAPQLGGNVPAIASLEAIARWDGASGSALLTGRESTGGTLRALASGRPDALAGLTGSIQATRFDLAPIAALLPGVRVPTAGILDADLGVQPGGRLTGTLHLAGGALPIAASVGTLRDVTADVSVGQTITGTIEGKLGRGTIRASIDAAPDLATIELRDLTLRQVSVLGGLGGLNPEISARAAASLHRDADRLRGTVTITDAQVALAGHAAAPLLDPTVPPDLVLPGVAPPVGEPGAPAPRAPVHPWLDVAVSLGPTRIDAHNVVDSIGLDIDALAHGDGLAVSVGDTVGVRGSVKIDGTYVTFLGRRYVLEPSELEFGGTTDPQLEIHLAYEFPELALRVALTGSASRPELQLSSDPAGYTQDQLTGFLVGGEPGGDATAQTGEAVRGALSLGVSARLGRELTKVLPIKLDALACELATTATSASCSGGRWLSQRMFLGYRKRFDPLPDENASELQLQYRLGHKSFELTGGDREHASLDLLWRLRW